MPGDSTKNQLVRVNDILSDALDKKKEVRVDISKAFDRVTQRPVIQIKENWGYMVVFLNGLKVIYPTEKKSNS